MLSIALWQKLLAEVSFRLGDLHPQLAYLGDCPGIPTIIAARRSNHSRDGEVSELKWPMRRALLEQF
jgi:hypothetical protein